MIDLHCHSNFSDGSLSPDDLLTKAIAANVKILALTDHDTTAGLAHLHTAANDNDIKIINGIELSVRWKKYDLHVIGLNIEYEDEDFCNLINKQNESRIERSRQIAIKLNNCGIKDALKKACDIAGHERVARPHFAEVLINEGRVKDMKAAFKQYLGQGCIAYVQTPWLSLEEAVLGITKCSGQAVIAHPLKYKLTRTKLHELIKEFKLYGGVGMEVVSGASTILEANELAGICKRFDLLASSGSDFHGESASYPSIGRQRALPLNCIPIWNQWNI